MGKLIVFEGVDGSGKSTQADMLCQRFSDEGIEFRRLKYPDYENPSSTLVQMYLRGEIGDDPDAINPYGASIFYAADRYISYLQDWKDYYDNGGILVADRYTSANAVHQGSKLTGVERREFFDWLYRLEFKQICLPMPDLTLLTWMPVELCVELMDSRGSTKDIHEKDVKYLQRCANTARIAAQYYGWVTVLGSRGGKIRDPQDISNEIRSIVKHNLDI